MDKLIKYFIDERCEYGIKLSMNIVEIRKGCIAIIKEKGSENIFSIPEGSKFTRDVKEILAAKEFPGFRTRNGHYGMVFHGIGIKGAVAKKKGRPKEPIELLSPPDLEDPRDTSIDCPAPHPDEPLSDPAAIPESQVNSLHDAILPDPMGSGGYVYFVRVKGTKLSPFPCKIGSSNSLKKRLSAIQTSNPEILEYFDYVYIDRNAAAVEYEIHAELKPLHILREWFSVTENQIKEIKAWIAIRKLSVLTPVVEACRTNGHTRSIADSGPKT